MSSVLNQCLMSTAASSMLLQQVGKTAVAAASASSISRCPFLHNKVESSSSSSSQSSYFSTHSATAQQTVEKNSVPETHPTTLTPQNAKDFFDKCPFAGVVEEGIKQNTEMGLEVLSTLMASPQQQQQESRDDLLVKEMIESTELKRKEMLLQQQHDDQYTTPTPYDNKFQSVIDGLKTEGRYRVFTTIQRQVGQFPYAKKFNNVDYDHYQHEQQEDQKVNNEYSRLGGINLLKTEELDVELQEESATQGDVAVWCSNDYLGMGQHRVVIDAMTASIRKMGAGSGGTRNISGTTSEHVRLEHELADLHKKDRALVFGSCYVANVNTITSLASALPDMVIFSDAKNHASLIEGIRNSRVEKHVFRHNDVAHLEQLLQSVDANRPKLIIFESVYSMDGTVAPIDDICTVAKRHNALTFIDEVHAVGLYGDHGAGVCERDGLMDRVDIVSGTLGKAFGVYGGYIASSARLIDLVRCLSPGFIFTTSLPPAIVAGACASVSYLKKSKRERDMHKSQTNSLKQALRNANLPLLETASHIVPLIVGDSARCKQMSDYLMAKHRIYVQPINYPTVPKGTERFRLTPSPVHNETAIKHLVSSMVDCWKKFGLTFTATTNN
ncbi:5-aminolevulinate synthase [Cavenderia fasciculata]|uniref:5-aminolevulinate synthase n=1 Tax=Cavenderia fasciculata TaxID=261658 RepID=F4PK51_CACFS|nr:5-aminolevulinate synthase [Cavenderia fasciculata]EGG23975.1 5-aminolevulinate synthase [Cavenderia fasciculata]|eukprot:XP_004361826.1 5-aminolevulinate synthase [Cavenderia fasciculata]